MKRGVMTVYQDDNNCVPEEISFITTPSCRMPQAESLSDNDSVVSTWDMDPCPAVIQETPLHPCHRRSLQGPIGSAMTGEDQGPPMMPKRKLSSGALVNLKRVSITDSKSDSSRRLPPLPRRQASLVPVVTQDLDTSMANTEQGESQPALKHSGTSIRDDERKATASPPRRSRRNDSIDTAYLSQAISLSPVKAGKPSKTPRRNTLTTWGF